MGYRKQIVIGVFLAAAILGISGLRAHQHSGLGVAHAQRLGQAVTCDDSSVDGAYGFLESGWVLAGPDGSPLTSPLPAAAVGTYTADGAGNSTSTFTQNIGGQVVHATLTGTYTVNADCSGTETEVDANGQAVHNAFVVEGGGNQLHFSETDPGAVLSGMAKPIDATTCSNATQTGTVGFLVTGFILVGPNGNPPPNPLPLSVVGVANSDGAGNSTVAETVNAGGNTAQAAQTRTYTVHADCTADETVTDTATGQILHDTGVLVNGGLESYFIGVDPGAVASGSAKRQ